MLSPAGIVLVPLLDPVYMKLPLLGYKNCTAIFWKCKISQMGEEPTLSKSVVGWLKFDPEEFYRKLLQLSNKLFL